MGGDFGANLRKKPWTIVQGTFPKYDIFLNGHNSKN